MSLLTKNLGTVIVTSKGDGLYAPGRIKTLALNIEFSIDPDEIERDDLGKIVFAYGHFEAKHDVWKWHTDINDGNSVPYTDTGISDGVNQFLRNLGFKGMVGWSERGRQEPGLCDFDFDYVLIDEIFPELTRKAA